MRISDILGRLIGNATKEQSKADADSDLVASANSTISSSIALEPSVADFDAKLYIEQYIAEASALQIGYHFDIKNLGTARAILELDPGLKIRVLLEALKGYQNVYLNRKLRLHVDGDVSSRYSALIQAIMRKSLPFDENNLTALLRLLVTGEGANRPSILTSTYIHDLPLSAFYTAIERHIAQHGISDTLRGLVIELKKFNDRGQYATASDHKLARRFDAMLGIVPEFPLKSGEAWADDARSRVAGMEPERKAAWLALLNYAAELSGGKPSRKWRAEAQKRIEACGVEEFNRNITEWLDRCASRNDEPMADCNSSTLKGLIWCCAIAGTSSLSRQLAGAAEGCYRKLPGIGARAQAPGNACIAVLSELDGIEPIAQLARLRLRVTNGQGLFLIGKAIDAAAARMNLSPNELEELVTPTYGLDDNGHLRCEFGECAVEIEVNGGRSVDVRWFGADGKPRKAIPAEVKRDNGAELKAFTALCADINKSLPAQRDRLDRILATDRHWPITIWRERYLKHPLIGGLSRKLIWHFSSGELACTAIWKAGEMVDSENRPVHWLNDQREDVTVRLWHPIGFSAKEVLLWRTYLENNLVAQPFKQAHREVYILTDAEINTGTYSNRFAAHILKQHQFAALGKERGWRYTLQGGWDGGTDSRATIDLPEWKMRAEFWVEGVDPEALSEAGIFLYVSTDQVRFYDRDNTLLSLADVPATVFTEVMRDCDLFVGVTSIGNDPAWQDNPAGHQHVDYWHSFSFGDLTESATTRKDLLTRLLPRLKIADRCLLDGKFLTVRGDIRSYKIHLGSGNILMSPNDQYLCIVPDRSSAGQANNEKLFLPFDGDRTLSVIISKAFMLADDKKIKDPTIIMQIGRA